MTKIKVKQLGRMIRIQTRVVEDSTDRYLREVLTGYFHY